MKRALAFAGRNLKELLRDPLMTIFCAGFPVGMLLLFWLLQKSIPADIFPLERMAPAITLFGLSFLSLFSGMLLARDRQSALLMRLFTTPMSDWGYLVGYILPLLPIAAAQILLCFGTAFLLGLAPSIRALAVVITMLPAALLFIGTGLLLGAVVNDKAVGGITSIVVNLAGLLGGVWFDLSLTGDAFVKFTDLLPFSHGVYLAQSAWEGNWSALPAHLLWVTGWAAVMLTGAVLLFRRFRTAK
ncbi:MAG: ABC transporter permease [Oscillospiraceae bacterium]|nr:ABC transporter permease [Oscillospiraceae bacterium]